MSDAGVRTAVPVAAIQHKVTWRSATIQEAWTCLVDRMLVRVYTKLSEKGDLSCREGEFLHPTVCRSSHQDNCMQAASGKAKCQSIDQRHALQRYSRATSVRRSAMLQKLHINVPGHVRQRSTGHRHIPRPLLATSGVFALLYRHCTDGLQRDRLMAVHWRP